MKHTCSICRKTEKCKEEDCDFINLLGFHSSCRSNQILEEEAMKPVDPRKRVLFSYEEVVGLMKAYQQMHNSNDMDDYEHGIVDGVEFFLFLNERME